MEKGNVLVIGNSGVGKSTLINAVMGEELAPTGWGTHGTTAALEIYETEASPFRIIDSIGFEPTFFKKQQAINAVKKWTKECAKQGNESNQINVIWFCVDGTSGKLFLDTIKSLCSAVKSWKGVPVITVITKSYSKPDREKNIKMVYQAFAEQKNSVTLKEVIPVVAQQFSIDDTSFVPPEGIAELIEKTCGVMPQGMEEAHQVVEKLVLDRNRSLAQAIVFGASAAASGVGLAPIPFPDASLIVPIETFEINAIAKLYGLDTKNNAAGLAQSLLEVGAVTVAARQMINALKAVPFINLAASVINAITAGVLATSLGEITVLACEKVYKGERGLEDTGWIKELLTEEQVAEIGKKMEQVLKLVAESTGKINISKIISTVFQDTNKKK